MFDLDEELLPKRKPSSLEGMSINELEEYIKKLEDKIAEVKRLISSKKAAASSAENFFKKNN